LTVVTFKVDSGTIKVYLPDDMAAGDTISGTVIAEPRGATAEDRSRSKGLLNGFVVEIGDKPTEPFQVSCKLRG
jgi:hypothetical protein